METVQRNATPAIPPFPAEWSVRRKIGIGLVAVIPLVLLFATFLCVLLQAVGVPLAARALPVVFYTHIGAQFITLLLFGHLMVSDPTLNPTGKLLWAIAFLFLAPFAIVAYWLTHVWAAWPPPPAENSHTSARQRFHVYDYDYSDDRPRGTEKREDGALIHHVDMTTV